MRKSKNMMEIKSTPKLTPLGARLNTRFAVSRESHFADVRNKIGRFLLHLKSAQDLLSQILSEYQSFATTQDEFQRIFECLETFDEMRAFIGGKTGSAAIFFPLNMPLYALILYGIFPALVVDHVSVRAPQRMTDLMQRLEPILGLSQYFPNIEIAYLSREEFIEHRVSHADIVVFTGKLVNAQYVLSRTKKNSLFLFNGWGCNPIVIGDKADLTTAAIKTVQARLFSSGQDCAGPDMILVPRNQAHRFVDLLKMELGKVKTGRYNEHDTVVGPLSDSDQLRLISSLLLRSSQNIVYGGYIDFATSTVHPTLIVGDLSQQMNFEELFAPVIYVSIYDNEQQLCQYFEHPLYKSNEMYVSLFGKCEYVENLKVSIIVKDQVIFDIDRGNDEFGGYSMGASFVACNHKITPKPVLVPRDIWDYIQPGSLGYQLNPNLQKKISKQARKLMMDHFASSLVFGFVFGSIAREEATGASDINCVVVLDRRDEKQIANYVAQLNDLHKKHSLALKKERSTIIITMDELNEKLQRIISSRVVNSLETDAELAILVEALSGTQCGVGGDKMLCVEYGRQVMKWSQTIEVKRMKKRANLAGDIPTTKQNSTSNEIKPDADTMIVTVSADQTLDQLHDTGAGGELNTTPQPSFLGLQKPTASGPTRKRSPRSLLHGLKSFLGQLRVKMSCGL